jgi:hypothetical protein
MLWLFLSLLFFGMSVIIFKEISETKVLMMDHTRFKPQWFKHKNGDVVKNLDELKVLFENYRWPMLYDLWIPITAAVIIGVS